MLRKRTLMPILLLLISPILACVTFASPINKGSEVTQPPEAPPAIVSSEAAPSKIPTSAPAAKPTSAPKATSVTSTTAALDPEKHVHVVTDETGAIEANIPTVWTDMRTEPWLDSNGKKIGTTFTAATNIDAFLKFQAEGAAFSVSNRLPIGYVRLLENEYKGYVKQCEDSYKTRWKLENDPVYNGMYFVFGKCAKTEYTWLSLFTAVDKKNPGQYIARIVAYDMAPIYGDDFRATIMKFKVHPEKLP